MQYNGLAAVNKVIEVYQTQCQNKEQKKDDKKLALEND